VDGVFTRAASYRLARPRLPEALRRSSSQLVDAIKFHAEHPSRPGIEGNRHEDDRRSCFESRCVPVGNGNVRTRVRTGGHVFVDQLPIRHCRCRAARRSQSRQPVGHGGLAEWRDLDQRQWHRRFDALQPGRHARSLVVEIPTAKQNRGTANPTGVVFNGTSFFRVTRNGHSAPALFIFVGEDGSISGWNPTVDPTHAIVAVDNGTNRGVNSAIYKGATLGVAGTHNFLYVTNFHTGKVETYDENFHQVNAGGFSDPSLPRGFAPFGIRNFNGEVFVTYAKQDSKREDDVAGPGLGFVNVFDTSGNFVRRLVSNGNLNAPWGLAIVDGELWVGNFGDGFINNYDPVT